MPKVSKKKKTTTRKKKRSSTSVSVQLPSSPSAPSQSIADYVMMIYGREKIGKTTFAAQFPDTFFLMTERGAKALSIREGYAANWTQLLEYIKLLEKSPGYCKTLVLDTIDNAAVYCQRYVCEKLVIDHPADSDYGKGWTAVKDEFRAMVQRLEALGVGLIFISHEKEKVIERRRSGNFTNIIPAASNQAREVIEPMLDMWFYYGVNDEGQRGLHLRGDDLIYAGHRPLPNGRLDEYSFIPSGLTDEETYNTFMSAWDGTLPVESSAAGKTSKKKASKKVAKKKASKKVTARRRR